MVNSVLPQCKWCGDRVCCLGVCKRKLSMLMVNSNKNKKVDCNKNGIRREQIEKKSKPDKV